MTMGRRDEDRKKQMERLREALKASPQGHAIRALLAAPAGQEFLRLLKEKYVLFPVFDENPRRLAYNAGQHDLVLEIGTLVEIVERTGE